jgi:hypothetical protein
MSYIKPTAEISEVSAWVPRLISGPGGGAISTEVHSAMYSKVGKFIFLTFDIQVIDMEAADNTSIVMLEGLPFSSIRADSYCGSVVFSYFKNLSSEIIFLSGSVLPDSYACCLWQESSKTTELQSLEYGDIKPKTRFQGTITYIAS